MARILFNILTSINMKPYDSFAKLFNIIARYRSVKQDDKLV